MVFSSTIFLFVFLPFTLLGYYLINPRFRNVFLLIVSLFFYAWGEPKFVFVMIFSIFMNYLFGLFVDKYRDNKKKAYFIIFVTVAFNVTLFFIFKYLNFTIRNLNLLFDDAIPQTDIALPIGISFFTFQAMSYVFDVYRRNGEVQKNPLNVALYVSFFPQLIAGPIVRYETVSNDIKNRKETFQDFVYGIKRFTIGMGKKVIISNSIAVVAEKAYAYTDYSELSVGFAWMGAIAYSLQILFDFSGYSDMAIGLGRMFGFHFVENFDYPYISKSVSEFWRRWHISLGTWFRDYVYFPLGGSRVKSKSRLILNLFAVWTLTGVWHGASWNFILWGIFYFVLLTFEKLTGIPKRFKSKLTQNIYRVFTLFSVMFGWVFFNAKDLSQGVNYVKAMFGAQHNALIGVAEHFWFDKTILIYIIAIILCTPVAKKILGLAQRNKACECVLSILEPVMFLLLFVLCIAYMVTSTYNPFIYFNF